MPSLVLDRNLYSCPPTSHQRAGASRLTASRLRPTSEHLSYVSISMWPDCHDVSHVASYTCHCLGCQRAGRRGHWYKRKPVFGNANAAEAHSLLGKLANNLPARLSRCYAEVPSLRENRDRPIPMATWVCVLLIATMINNVQKFSCVPKKWKYITKTKKRCF